MTSRPFTRPAPKAGSDFTTSDLLSSLSKSADHPSSGARVALCERLLSDARRCLRAAPPAVRGVEVGESICWWRRRNSRLVCAERGASAERSGGSSTPRRLPCAGSSPGLGSEASPPSPRARASTLICGPHARQPLAFASCFAMSRPAPAIHLGLACGKARCPFSQPPRSNPSVAMSPQSLCGKVVQFLHADLTAKAKEDSASRRFRRPKCLSGLASRPPRHRACSSAPGSLRFSSAPSDA